MPAVELTKLRQQIDRLVELFDQPDEFQRAVRQLYEHYTDLAYHPGQTVTRRSPIPSYRPPALLTRRLELDLTAACLARSEQALAIVDRLWAETYLEPRLLAATLLGQIPLSQGEGIMERLRAWAQPREDRSVLEALLERGAARLRTEGPDALLELYDSWLSAPDAERRLIGLKGLLPLINDPAFENLPPIFSMLNPIVRTVDAAAFNELAVVLGALAARTPIETAYFLRQAISAPHQANTPRLVRKILPLLSESAQESLRAALKARS